MDDERHEDAPKVRVVNKRVAHTEGTPPTSGDAPFTEAEAAGQPAADADLEAARAQAAQYLDDLKRLKAEFENFRKRALKEQTALVERAGASLIERLLPVLDNFELALIAADRTKDYEAMVRGVELVYAELLGVLEKEGLQRIDAAGKPFDPEEHEAVMQEEGEGDEVFVADEIRKGYRLGGRVLRPSMVKVTKR